MYGTACLVYGDEAWNEARYGWACASTPGVTYNTSLAGTRLTCRDRVSKEGFVRSPPTTGSRVSMHLPVHRTFRVLQESQVLSSLRPGAGTGDTSSCTMFTEFTDRRETIVSQ